MQVANNDLSKKWVLMDGHENLMRIGEVKLANEKKPRKKLFLCILCKASREMG